MDQTTTCVNTWVQNKLEKLGPEWLETNAENLELLRKRHHTEDTHFALWMTRLNARVQRRVMMSYDDLEDWDYWSAYAGDVHPAEAADDMLADLGYDWEVDY